MSSCIGAVAASTSMKQLQVTGQEICLEITVKETERIEFICRGQGKLSCHELQLEHFHRDFPQIFAQQPTEPDTLLIRDLALKSTSFTTERQSALVQFGRTFTAAMLHLTFGEISAPNFVAMMAQGRLCDSVKNLTLCYHTQIILDMFVREDLCLYAGIASLLFSLQQNQLVQLSLVRFDDMPSYLTNPHRLPTDRRDLRFMRTQMLAGIHWHTDSLEKIAVVDGNIGIVDSAFACKDLIAKCPRLTAISLPHSYDLNYFNTLRTVDRAARLRLQTVDIAIGHPIHAARPKALVWLLPNLTLVRLRFWGVAQPNFEAVTDLLHNYIFGAEAPEVTLQLKTDLYLDRDKIWSHPRLKQYAIEKSKNVQCMSFRTLIGGRLNFCNWNE